MDEPGTRSWVWESVHKKGGVWGVNVGRPIVTNGEFAASWLLPKSLWVSATISNSLVVFIISYTDPEHSV